MKKTASINPKWTDYDKSVGQCQLINYGVIYLDEYDLPIDDEYLLEDLHKEERK